MSRNTALSTTLLGAGLAAAALSVVGAFWSWLAVVGGVLAGVLVLLQYRQSGAYVRDVETAEWAPIAGTSQHSVLITGHNRGTHPTVEVYEHSPDGSFAQVSCDVHVMPNGDVRLEIDIAPQRLQVRIV